ncbi:MAG: redoxin domain-containing protein [Actinomycetota bacterium]
MRRFLSLALVLAACSTPARMGTEAAPIPETNPAAFRQILADLDRPAVVNVWAAWCLPCRAEAALFERAHQQYGDRIEFIGLDFEDAQNAARQFLDEFGLTFTQYFDPTGAVAADLGGIGVPRTFFFAPGGDLVRTHNGIIDEQTLALFIDELLAPSP